MVDQRLVTGLVVAAAAITTLIVGRFIVKEAGGETGPDEPLPPEDVTKPTIQAGTF